MSGAPRIHVAELGDAIVAAANSVKTGVVVVQLGPPPALVYVSEGAAALFGLSLDDAYRIPPMEIAAPEARADLRARLEARWRGDPVPPTFASVIRRPDGTAVPVQLGAGDAELDGAPVTVVFISDMSERWQAEQAVRRSEARSRALIESAPDAIVISRARRIVYANPAAAALLAYPDGAAMVGMDFGEVLHAEDYRTMGERIATLEVGGKPLGPYEYRARAKDGRAVVVEVTSVMFEDTDGPAVIGFARDVTDSRRLQAQLMRADRLAALGTLAAGVAHEINNPLAFMLLGLDAIDRLLARRDPDLTPVRSTVADVRHGIERISAIVKQLRVFSRADEGRSRGAADLRIAIDAAARMAAHEIKQVGRLEVQVEGGLPLVRGEAAQIEQVFLNLLLNAAQALEDAGNRGLVEVVARARDAQTIEVLVRDDGRGIHERDLPRVFDPFFTTKPAGAGTGLGLSICHSIVNAMGGDITLDSRPDEGTTVRVVLPVSRSTAPGRSTPPVPARRGPPVALSILVADDEPAFLRAMEQLLVGHDVTAVDDGELAWDQIAHRSFDALFLDVTMPALNGVELFERLRAERPELEERVVFVTAGTSRERVEKSLLRSGRPILRKPFEAEQVSTVLRRIRRP